MTKTKAISPEEIFHQAVAMGGEQFSPGEYRLLMSGLQALREVCEKRLNGIELMAVKSMIAYIAYTRKISEEIVSNMVVTQFGVNDITRLLSRSYFDIIEYLIDLETAKLVN